MRTGNCSFRVALSSRSKYWSIRICNLSGKFFFLKNMNLISYTVTIHFCDRIIHRLNTNAKEFSFSLKLGHFLPLFFFAIRILKSAQSLFNLMKCTEISLKPSPKTQFFFRKKNQYAWRFRDYCKIIKSNSFIKRKCKVWSDKKKIREIELFPHLTSTGWKNSWNFFVSCLFTLATGMSRIFPQVFMRWHRHSKSSAWSEIGCFFRPTRSCSQQRWRMVSWTISSLP